MLSTTADRLTRKAYQDSADPTPWLRADAGKDRPRSRPAAEPLPPVGAFGTALRSPCIGSLPSGLERLAREVRLPAGAYLYRQGGPVDNVYVVRDGWLFSSVRFSDGRRQIVKIVLPGDIVGPSPSEAPRPADSSLETLTPARLAVLPRRALGALAAERPDLTAWFGEIAADDLRRISRRLASLGRQTAYERLAHFLLEIFCRVRSLSAEPVGDTIRMPLTQEHLADTLGLTSVHVSRILAQLRQDGLVHVSRRSLQVADLAGLAEIADFDISGLEGAHA